ncbi:MAG: hypothetical protein ACRDJH_08300, partial [Thermomicrobiales bacterium]
RLPAQRVAEADDPLLAQAATASADLQRLALDSPVALKPGAILTMQRKVGNQTVVRLLEPRVQRRAAVPASTATLAKTVDNEEELAKSANNEEHLAKTVNQEEELAKAPTLHRSADHVAVSVQQTAPLHNSLIGPDDGLLAKVSTSVKSGAAATIGLGGDYGLTYPERVDASISAKLDKTAGTWSPKVKSLKGHYSLQASLLAGQTEITGPSGNTSTTNFCDQATALEKLGYGGGHKWYILKAVKVHEAVHAKHFAPALKAVEAAITANLEAVTVPHTAGMKSSKAIKDIQADPTYIAEIANAQSLWLAEILTRAAGDHASGGPTDTAEKTVTEPMRKKICRHAKKKKWAACAACP